MRELAAGLDVLGSKARDDILPGLRALHVARGGRRGRHFFLYRATANLEIEILRALHVEPCLHPPTTGDDL
jgi:toxin ParE1/3/4